MYNTLEIEFLLFYLRKELEHVDRAIVDLERKARKAHPRGVGLTKRPVSRALENAGRDWTRHRLRAS
jgi:hypothetical protein